MPEGDSGPDAFGQYVNLGSRPGGRVGAVEFVGLYGGKILVVTTLKDGFKNVPHYVPLRPVNEPVNLFLCPKHDCAEGRA